MLDAKRASPEGIAMSERSGENAPKAALAIVGGNATLIWGMRSAERIARIARANGAEVVEDPARATLLANAGFAFDPSWLKPIAAEAGQALTLGGVPVLAHVRSADEAVAVAAAMEAGEAQLPLGLRQIAGEGGASFVNEALRKREAPFVMPLTPGTVRAAERASYFGAYKGVTDLLTKYLWPEWALVLTRIAARIGMTPNMVTGVGFLLCVFATWAFTEGHYWPGLATGLVFMVLDTVDGKLARCTITSSWWGNVFDHGIDLIHPPIWWWAWAAGLAAYGRPLSYETIWISLAIIFAAYVLQRGIEGWFIAAFKMHIHVWRRADSLFRLVTARRNPNVLLLFVFLLVGRPDWGLVALAAWTAFSLLFHLVRIGQAYAARAGGRPIRSWLDG
jgi:phosphatidylglycerophosphate synthase